MAGFSSGVASEGFEPPKAEPADLQSSSASYIVVPAVLRYAIPEANPSIYFGLSLGVTFPLNILIGIPLYIFLAKNVIAV